MNIKLTFDSAKELIHETHATTESTNGRLLW